jgi:hypothetical protein
VVLVNLQLLTDAEFDEIFAALREFWSDVLALSERPDAPPGPVVPLVESVLRSVREMHAEARRRLLIDVAVASMPPSDFDAELRDLDGGGS